MAVKFLEPDLVLEKDNRPHYFFSREAMEPMLSNWDEDPERLMKALRVNVVSMVQFAGSGHLGTSLSSLDAMAAAYICASTSEARNLEFFSSKGHDAPALYAVLHLFGFISDDHLSKLRRLGGLPGHPELGTAGVIANTGSLGMGVSKAKGRLLAARLAGEAKAAFVMLGDGETNEGQVWESLSTAVKWEMGNLVVLVDSNAIQSDSWVASQFEAEALREKFLTFGFDSKVLLHGNNLPQLVEHFKSLDFADTRPKALILRTTKGHGVSFMERFPRDGRFYKYHSGSLTAQEYEAAVSELKGQPEVTGGNFRNAHEPGGPQAKSIEDWKTVLQSVHDTVTNSVFMDADLCLDTGTWVVSGSERYYQFGIAEQDMVSAAGAMALTGYLPFVHSFSSFLTTRPFEQILNNASEATTVIYVGFLGGLIPSAPGFSHQAVTDVSAMLSIPNMRVFEPCCVDSLERCVQLGIAHRGPSYLRINTYTPSAGCSAKHFWGERVGFNRNPPTVLIAYAGYLAGDIATETSSALKKIGIDALVISFPEHSGALSHEMASLVADSDLLLVIQNSNRGNSILDSIVRLNSRVVHRYIEGFPANGQPNEVLEASGFHSAQLVSQVVDALAEEANRD